MVSDDEIFKKKFLIVLGKFCGIKMVADEKFLLSSLMLIENHWWLDVFANKGFNRLRV